MNTDALKTDTEGDEPAEVKKQTKSKRLASHLRKQIVATLLPESRLASYQELEQEFAVSRAVVREAITQLKREGFVQSVDRQGLYVSDWPPHLSRFGMVFADNPSSPEWPRFFTALQQEAAALHRQSEGISFAHYYDIRRGPGTDSYERLQADVESHRLAGLMLLPPAHGLDRAEPFSSPAIPKVYICGEPEEGRVPSVTTCHVQMCERMLRWLHERGRKRVAVVTMWGYHVELHDFLRPRGVPYRPHWFQTVGRDNQADVREVVALLMDYPPEQRPDGLMILDDNLTEHAVGGLLQSGLRVGQDIDVIAHCNWPWPVASPVPIQRIGFHAGHLVSLAVRAIQLARSNQPLAVQQVKDSPLFESELSQPWEPVAFDK
jgi:DNA-binding LacI/PurR family transcriptional regulator/biotin operon repressor